MEICYKVFHQICLSSRNQKTRQFTIFPTNTETRRTSKCPFKRPTRFAKHELE